MNGDFEEDDFSDISVGNTKKKKKRQQRNPDDLSDSDDDESHGGEEVKFTADGQKIEANSGEKKSDSDDDDSDAEDEDYHPLSEGTRVRGNYRAAEQFKGRENWYEGKITNVHEYNGSITYDIEYDDGDTEKNILPKNVRPVEEIQKEEKKIDESKNIAKLEQLKRKKAKAKARYVPY